MKSDLISPNGQRLRADFDDERLSFMCNGGKPINFIVEGGDSFSINVVVNPDKKFQLHFIGMIQGVSYTLALSEPFDDLAELLATTAALTEVMIRN